MENKFFITFSNSWYIDRKDFFNQQNIKENAKYNYPFISWHFDTQADGEQLVYLSDYKLSIDTIKNLKENSLFQEENKIFIDKKNNHTFKGSLIDALLYIKNQEGKLWN